MMNHRFLAVAASFLLFLTSGLRAIDATWNYTVEIGVTVQASPAQIRLSWAQDTNGAPANYILYRKAPTATDWGTPLATVSGSITTYNDNAVTVGTVYEYQIVKDFSAARGYRGYGYVQAAVNAPLADSRGTVVLIVDNATSGSIGPELQRLIQDMVGDGWFVIRHEVGRGDSPSSVKNLIRADYLADPTKVNTVFLFGHVPVPYSGAIAPDGHPGHMGAWPADVYYGDLDGQWTDSTVTAAPAPGENSDPADVARLRNVPGDGKFDQSTVPGTVKLQVGRVDLSNMPGFLQYQSNPSFPSETELLRNYLNKDHNFRHGLLNVRRRALMGDYSGDKDGIAPAASGFRSFSPIVGEPNITNLNILNNDAPGVWLPTLKTNDYLFALGCGAGSYSTVSGIGTRGPYSDASSTDLVSNDIRAVFVMLFGSWNGDWDSQDNILRSVLATPTYGLAAMYTGVPHWFLHPMGLGETLGYCARLTQNNANPGLYLTQVNLSAREVHIALMGDPTLRLNPVAPVTTLSGTSAAAATVNLNWVASSDAATTGYHIYRASSASGPFTRLTTTPVTQTSFTDSTAPAGANSYMVRAVKLETTPSGSYFNGSQGAVITTTVSGAVTPPPTSRLINVSVRSNAGTGSQTLALGFVIGGGTTSASLPVLIRATGPGLQVFGVTGVLPDPILTVYQGATVVGANDNWGANAAQVSATGTAVGAFPIADSASKDAALVATYSPQPYSAAVTGSGGSSGNALVEVYDASTGAYTAAQSRLLNLSARTQVGTGADILSVGFVVTGTTPLKILLRAVGRGLEKFGVTGVLVSPQLKLIASDGQVVAINSGWANDPALAATAAQVGAFALDAGSTDSALVATLPPGAYTAQIVGANGTVGVALAEVYEVK